MTRPRLASHRESGALKRLMSMAVITALMFCTAAQATVRSADIRWADSRIRNLYRIFKCETGGINGGRPLWTHHNSTYTGAGGFLHSSWRQYKRYVRPIPRARYAAQATPLQQYAVSLVLVERYGWTPWPSCSRRLGLR